MVTLIPSWANSTGGSPYSLSKAHLAPLVSANHHSASRTLTTNQPWMTGVSPDPKSSSCASGTDAILAPRDGRSRFRGALETVHPEVSAALVRLGRSRPLLGRRRDASAPGQLAPRVRAAEAPVRERRVSLGRAARLRPDACAVSTRGLRDRVDDGAVLAPCACHEDHARLLAGADEGVVGPGRAVDEVPGAQRPLLLLHYEQALSGEHEEVLLARLGVVHAGR